MQQEDIIFKNRIVEVNEVFQNCIDAIGERFIPITELQARIGISLTILSREQRMAMCLSDDAELSILCKFVTSSLTVDPPLMQMESSGCDELTDRLQRKLTSFLKNSWPPQTRIKAIKFLNNLIHFMDFSVAHINETCVICDEILEFPGLKATSCRNPLCVFTFEELSFRRCHQSTDNGVMPQVNQLIVIIARAAILSAARIRLDAMLSTIPTEFMNDSGVLSYDLLRATAESIIPDNMFKHDVRIPCTPLEARLYRWLLSTNRATIFHLDKDQRIEAMVTSHQFQICLSGVTAEKQFDDLKQKYGSLYAFHGSLLHNWYGIIRNGLKNYSNTNLMTTGAAYGPGIYLATNSSTSSSYMGYSQSISCIALCEVAKVPTLKISGGIVIADNEHAVSVRFLFCYAGQNVPHLEASKLVDHPTVNACEVLRAQLARKTPMKFRQPDDHDDNFGHVRSSDESQNTDSDDMCSSTDDGHDYDDVEVDDAFPYHTKQTQISNLLIAKNRESTKQVAISEIVSDTANNVRGFNVPAQLRLSKELKSMHNFCRKDHGFEASPVNDDLFNWQAKLWLNSGSLSDDMKAYANIHGRDFIELRMEFPDDYPTSPPFVWLLQPVLEFGTGFVSRGAICSTLLLNTGTKAAWSPVYTIDTILINLLANFQDPSANGKIRNIQQPLRYSLEEARGGWSRAKTLHGW